MGGGLGEFRSVITSEVDRDQARAAEYAKNYSGEWLKRAEGTTVRKAVTAANEGTLGALRRIGVTESSESFNTGRAKALKQVPATGLLRVWDATLDRRACPICGRADGYIVGIHERFPWGEPGSVHPWCRCGFTVLRTDDGADEIYIEPTPVQPVRTFGPALRPAGTGKAAKATAEFEAKTWAGSLDKAFTSRTKDGGQAIREQTRALLARDGLVSKDVARKLARSSALDQVPSRGVSYHDWNGQVALDQISLNRAHRASRKLARGETLAADELDGLQTLIHEEIHGTSLIVKEAFTPGLGVALEEASTELVARNITGKLTGQFATGVYENEIRGLTAAVRSVTKLDAAGAQTKIVEASTKLRAKKLGVVSTADEHADEFVAALKGLKVADRNRLSILLKEEKWWEPDVAERLERI